MGAKIGDWMPMIMTFPHGLIFSNFINCFIAKYQILN